MGKCRTEVKLDDEKKTKPRCTILKSEKSKKKISNMLTLLAT